MINFAIIVQLEYLFMLCWMEAPLDRIFCDGY